MRGTLPVIHWHESAAGQRLLHPRSYGLIFTTAHLTWCSVRRALWSDFMLRMESWTLTDDSNRNLHLHFNLQVTSVDCFPSRNRMINLPTKRSICNQTEPIRAGKHGSVGLTKAMRVLVLSGFWRLKLKRPNGFYFCSIKYCLQLCPLWSADIKHNWPTLLLLRKQSPSGNNKLVKDCVLWDTINFISAKCIVVVSFTVETKKKKTLPVILVHICKLN